MAEVKQVIVLNGELNMSPGKAAAQAAHASVGAFERAEKKDIALWHEFGVTKIVLRANTAQNLEAIADGARYRKLPHFLVADAGRTEIEPGSITALGIGPADADLINKLTGLLPLY